MIQAFRFFLANAGYVVGVRARCALRLARAEQRAADLGWAFEWLYDDEPWDGDVPGYTPREVLGCVVRGPDGEVLASLWGIADPSPAYSRVVEAELASEALYHEDEARSYMAL